MLNFYSLKVNRNPYLDNNIRFKISCIIPELQIFSYQNLDNDGKYRIYYAPIITLFVRCLKRLFNQNLRSLNINKESVFANGTIKVKFNRLIIDFTCDHPNIDLIAEAIKVTLNPAIAVFSLKNISRSGVYEIMNRQCSIIQVQQELNKLFEACVRSYKKLIIESKEPVPDYIIKKFGLII